MQPVIDNWLQYSSSEVTPQDRVLTQKLNYYNAVMLERAVQYHEALGRMNVDPTQIINTNEGPKTIEVIVEIRRVALLEVVSTVEVAQLMLKAATEGDVTKFYTGDALSIPTWTPERVAVLAEQDKEQK